MLLPLMYYLSQHLKLHCFCKLWAQGQGVPIDPQGREADLGAACHLVLLWACYSRRWLGVRILACLHCLGLSCFYLITDTIHKR